MDTDMPPLEIDGDIILTISSQSTSWCNECGSTGDMFVKTVLWHLTDHIVVYKQMYLCVSCWPLISWDYAYPEEDSNYHWNI